MITHEHINYKKSLGKFSQCLLKPSFCLGKNFANFLVIFMQRPKKFIKRKKTLSSNRRGSWKANIPDGGGIFTFTPVKKK